MKSDNKKRTIIILTLVVAFVLINMLAYKIALLLINKPLEGNGYKVLETTGDVIEITHIKDNNTKEYVDLVYPVLDSSFAFEKAKSNNIYSSFYSYAENNMTLNSTFRVGTSYDYVDRMINMSDTLGVEANTKLFEKANIKTNFDVIDWLKKYYDSSINLFTSKDDIRLRYMMNTFLNTVVEEGTYYPITGDLEGYMLVNKDKSSFEVNLKQDNKYYTLMFTNASIEYYNFDKVIDFLSRVEIKKQG